MHNYPVKDLFQRNVPGTVEILGNVTIGIAGCGGLGSNAAVALCRSGVGNFILVDFDLVEIHNLNRQAYYLDDIGKYKVAALKSHLENINPQVKVTIYQIKLDSKNFLDVFQGAEGLIEGFDNAYEKKWLIEHWCSNKPDLPLVSGSGMSGLSPFSDISSMRAGNLVMCGDQISQASEGLNSARVNIVSNLQALEMIRLILEKKGYHYDISK